VYLIYWLGHLRALYKYLIFLGDYVLLGMRPRTCFALSASAEAVH
jgi:hypothetical protein